MSDRVFMDTNVLVYTRDASEPRKQNLAIAWMKHLWGAGNGRVSFQVLQEFYVTVTEKLKPGLDPNQARRNVQALFAWRPIPIETKVIQAAWPNQDRLRLSWWDSLIVAAAQIGDCRYLLTEDLHEGQEFGNLRVVNPFAHSPESLSL